MFQVLFFASTAFLVEAISAASLGLSTDLPSPGFNFPNLDWTSKPECPAIRCALPTCSGKLETPKDENGCPMCPKCVGVQTVPNIRAASVATVFNYDLDDVISPWPCPIPMCIPPPCPEWQQEMYYNAQGCPMCRVCKPGVGTFPNVLASASLRTADINANLDLDLTSVRPCPLARCIPPPCLEWQQETLKDDRGCPMCPVCKNPVFTAERDVNANLNLGVTARICPPLFCPPLACLSVFQVKTNGPNGCPGCPRCLDINIPLPKQRWDPIPDPGPLLNVPVPKLEAPDTLGR